MLIFTPQSLAFIAVPKTGTTAVEMALKPKADIVFTKQRKHMTAQRFHKKIAPFLDAAFDLRPDPMAVMRDPEEQVRSWYRYRNRDRNVETPTSTKELSFDQFVLDVIADDPPKYAGIGSQYKMLTSARGAVLVEHLFAYETPTLFHNFLDERFGQAIVLKQKNVSPRVDAPLGSDTRRKLHAARATEFDLYHRLMDAGGHLVTSQG
ncbi:MAG: hypothetical protein ACI92Z_000872 [Paracoccaceae bacterium]|jgi:hypothetical protein